MPRPPHPQFEALGREAQLRLGQGRKDYITSTARDYRVHPATVRNALIRLGVLDRKTSHRKYNPLGVRLTKAECEAINWCPECGNIHIYLRCEWCAGWREGKLERYEATRDHKRFMLEKKRYFLAYARDKQKRYFFNNAPPTKDG